MPIQQLINYHYQALAKLYLESRGRSIDDNGGADWIEAAKALQIVHAGLTLGVEGDAPLTPAGEDYATFLAETFGDAHLITVPNGDREYPAVKIVDGKPIVPALNEPGMDTIAVALGALEQAKFVLERIGQSKPEGLLLSAAEELLQARARTTRYFLAHKDE